MDIQNRMNEISFNGSLLKELRGIDFVDRLIRQGKLSSDEYRQVRVHVIENQAELKPLGASSKMNVEWDFLTMLRDTGRETATRWLDANFADIGTRSTVDLRAMFEGIGGQHQG
jgi:NTE family protein